MSGAVDAGRVDEVAGDAQHRRDVLGQLRREELRRVRVRTDPFDLALSWLDPGQLEELPATLAARLGDLRAQLEEGNTRRADVVGHLAVAEDWSFRHALHRLSSEIAFLQQLSTAVPEIVSDERWRFGA